MLASWRATRRRGSRLAALGYPLNALPAETRQRLLVSVGHLISTLPVVAFFAACSPDSPSFIVLLVVFTIAVGEMILPASTGGAGVVVACAIPPTKGPPLAVAIAVMQSSSTKQSCQRNLLGCAATQERCRCAESLLQRLHQRAERPTGSTAQSFSANRAPATPLELPTR